MIFMILSILFLIVLTLGAQPGLLLLQLDIPHQYLEAGESAVQDFVYQVDQKSIEVTDGGESFLPLLLSHPRVLSNISSLLVGRYPLRDKLLVCIVALKGQLILKELNEIPSGILR